MALDIRERLARNEPGNVERQRDLAIGDAVRGDLAQAAGALEAARAAYAKAREIGRILVNAPPAAADIYDVLAGACRKEAHVPAQLEPGTPPATLRAISEEGRASLWKLS